MFAAYNVNDWTWWVERRIREQMALNWKGSWKLLISKTAKNLLCCTICSLCYHRDPQTEREFYLPVEVPSASLSSSTPDRHSPFLLTFFKTGMVQTVIYKASSLFTKGNCKFGMRDTDNSKGWSKVLFLVCFKTLKTALIYRPRFNISWGENILSKVFLGKYNLWATLLWTPAKGSSLTQNLFCGMSQLIHHK